MTSAPDARIAALLRDDEALVAVVEALAPMSLFARWFVGFGSEEFAGCRIVVTSSRIVVLMASGAVSEVSHADVVAFRIVPLVNTLTLTYRSGRQETFTLHTPEDAATLADVLPKLAGNGASSEEHERRRTCGGCSKELTSGAAQCRSCGTSFRRRGTAILRALLLPGAGYYYLGFDTAGFIDIAVNLACIAAIAGARAFTTTFDVWSAGTMIGVAFAVLAVWRVCVVIHTFELTRECIPLKPKQHDEPHSETTWVEIGSPPPVLKLKSETVYGVRIAPAVLWSDEANKPSTEAKHEQVRFLERIAPVLRPVLEPGEMILFISNGSPPFTLADFLTPLRVLFLMKRCLYVFTNLRVIQVPVSVNGAPRPSFFALRWADAAGYTFTGGFTFGSFINFKLRCFTPRGARVDLARLPFATVRKITPMLKRVAGSGTPSAHEGFHALCPACGGEAPLEVALCRACRARFRNRRSAPLLALAVSGGGYAACGYWGMAAAMFAYETGLVFSAIVGGFIESPRMTITSIGLFLVQKLSAVAHARELSRERVLRDPPSRRRYLAEEQLSR